MVFCGLRSVKPTPSGLPPESLSGKGYVLHSRALCQSWISVSTPFSGRFTANKIDANINWFFKQRYFSSVYERSSTNLYRYCIKRLMICTI